MSTSNNCSKGEWVSGVATVPNVIKPMAVTTALRSRVLPDVPTLKEAGVDGIDMSTWYGLGRHGQAADR